MTGPFVVLATYEPPYKIWKAWKVGRDITRITKEAGLKPHVDPIHGPILTASWSNVELHAEVRRFTSEKESAEDWHQDGDTTLGSNMNCAMVLWASTTPTEIQYEGKIYRPDPFQVVIFSNKKVSHRRPANCPKDRWIFRQRVRMPDWL